MPRRGLCGSRVFEERGALKVILPNNLIDDLKLKDGDWLIWKSYHVSSKGYVVLRVELRRGREHERDNRPREVARRH